MINTDSIKIVHKKPQNYNDITESSTIMSNDSYNDEYTNNTNNKICKKIHNNIIKEINKYIESDNEIKIKNNIFILFFEYLKQNYDSKQDLNELIDNFIEIYSLDQNDKIILINLINKDNNINKIDNIKEDKIDNIKEDKIDNIKVDNNIINFDKISDNYLNNINYYYIFIGIIIILLIYLIIY